MSDFELYAIVDPRRPGAIARAMRQMSLGPRLAIQIRAKGAGASMHDDAVRQLVAPATAAGVALYVSTHVEVAAKHHIGVHLPESAPELEAIRRTFRGPVGASCHDAAGLLRRRGAEFAVLGPVTAVPNKNDALGWEAFSALVRSSPIPVYALGGIVDAADVRRAKASGARGAAVERAFWSHELVDLVR